MTAAPLRFRKAQPSPTVKQCYVSIDGRYVIKQSAFSHWWALFFNEEGGQRLWIGNYALMSGARAAAARHQETDV